MFIVWVIRLAAIGVLVGLWQGASAFGWADPSLLPPVEVIAPAIVRLLGDPEFHREVATTSSRVALAFLIGAPLAIALGVAAGESEKVRRYVNPAIYFGISVPQSIFLPLFILLLGIGMTQKVVFGITHVIFIGMLTAMTGVMAIPASIGLLARSLGASRRQTFLKFYLPAMLPHLITGLRIGLVFDIIGVLLAEMYASRDGLGILIFSWSENFKTGEMMAAILLVSCSTIFVNESLRVLEHRLGRWRLTTA